MRICKLWRRKPRAAFKLGALEQWREREREREKKKNTACTHCTCEYMCGGVWLVRLFGMRQAD